MKWSAVFGYDYPRKRRSRQILQDCVNGARPVNTSRTSPFLTFIAFGTSGSYQAPQAA
jgi:hypothetical protein